MESSNLIERFGLGLAIVVLWVLALLKSFAYALSHGTDKYIGKTLITLVGMMFVYFIYPFMFLYSTLYNPTKGSYVLLYSVATYATIFMVGSTIDLLVGPILDRKKRALTP